ncbi:MAG TPA: PD-(D/E)XK nuclease family protein, partial [Amaricoccus sp.]|nr:PD-(D/E)XK nuclease family protein [Amaricoccus sp.]
ARPRGTAVHALLEHLQGAPVEARAALAARLLGEDAPDLLAEASAVLDSDALAFLFGPDSLAEVDVAAPIASGRILGRIDRLVVAADRVLAVDFKSNRAVPERPEDVPEGILRQLGAYRAALAPIWPGRTVAVAVLWTRTAELMPVPAPLADAAFARAVS